MIVLDEQLLGRNLEIEIARWYAGTVYYITELRPNTIIKDDAIPMLLREQSQPTFVTINVQDFWRHTPPSEDYCIVCFALPDSRVQEIPTRLRLLFDDIEFKTKAARMSKVVQIAEQGVTYYTLQDRTIRKIQK